MQNIKWRKEKLKFYDNLWGILFTIIPIVGTTVFVFIPLFITIFVSFTSWSGNVMFWEATIKEPLFDNYIKILEDERFWETLYNTVFYMIGIPIGIALSLVLALCMNRGIRFKNAFRVIYYVPVIASIVSIVILFSKMFDIDGIVNKVITTFGGEKINFVDGDEVMKKTTIIIVMVWKGLGGSILLFLAGLQGINKTYFEAARLDGAGSIKIFFKITLPQLYPVVFFMIVTSIIGGAQIFTEPALFYPQGGYDVIPYVAYLKSRFEIQFAGRSAAMGVLLMLAILVVTAIQFYINSRKEDSN